MYWQEADFPERKWSDREAWCMMVPMSVRTVREVEVAWGVSLDIKLGRWELSFCKNSSGIVSIKLTSIHSMWVRGKTLAQTDLPNSPSIWLEIGRDETRDVRLWSSPFDSGSSRGSIAADLFPDRFGRFGFTRKSSQQAS